MKTSITKSLLLSIMLITTGPGFAGDCDKAKTLFDKGLEAGKKEQWTDAKKWLSQSVAECNRFDNWYLLGQVEQTLENYTAAAAAFEDARKHSKSDNETALAIGRYAETLSQQGKLSEPLALLHHARKLHSNSPKWMTMLAMRLDKKRASQELTVTQVTRGLKNKSISLLGPSARSSINISINFESNSTNVTEDSMSNINTLAKALDDDALKNDVVTLVGHSDIRGQDKYNQSLSVKRAERIAQMLLSANPSLEGRIKIEGAGESQPLYDGADEEVHRLNRRIEVFVEN